MEQCCKGQVISLMTYFASSIALYSDMYKMQYFTLINNKYNQESRNTK